MNHLKWMWILSFGLMYLSSPVYAEGNLFERLKKQVTDQVKQTKEGVVTTVEEEVIKTVDDTTNAIIGAPDSAETNFSTANPVVNGESANTSVSRGARVESAGASAASGQIASIPTRQRGRSTPGDVNVVGLRLGMTAQEAKGALQAHDAAMRIEEKHGQLPLVHSQYLQALVASSSAGEMIVMEFAPPPGEPVMIKLARTTGYAQGAQPSLNNTLQALTQKYGAPTVDKNDNAAARQLIWLYDREGNRLVSAPGEMMQRCTVVSLELLMASGQQDKALAECGTALSVMLLTGVKPTANMQAIESTGLVGQLSATLTNVAEQVRTAQDTRTYIDTTMKKKGEDVGAPKL